MFNKIKFLLIIILLIILLITKYTIPNCINWKLRRPLIKILLNLQNNKIETFGDKSLLRKKGKVYISNHYNALDTAIIYSLLKNNTYCVAKSDLLNEVFPKKSNLKDFEKWLISKVLFKSTNLISYERNNRESGSKVQEIILDKINNGYNVLVFPEGTSSRKGIPKSFKNGLFKLCSDNDIPIIPLTLKFEKDIGLDIKDKFLIKDMFNNNVKLFLHPEVKSRDYLKLKKKCFNSIVKVL